jgi:hypothetical protein
MLILVCGVGSTLAYLATQTGQVQNTFEPAYVTSEVQETFANNVKSNVTIKNTGNVSAYIRAAIVVTWKDAAGNTMPQAPGTGDYTLTIGSDWTEVGGYYYYNKSVAANASTTDLIVRCEPIKPYPDGRKLCVEVIGSAIQSEGMGATSAQDAFQKASGTPGN